MHTTSQAYKTKIASNERNIVAKVVWEYQGTTYQLDGDHTLMHLEYHASADPSSVLTIGSLATKYVTYTYYDEGTFYDQPGVGSTVRVYAGVRVSAPSTDEYVLLGTYYVTSLERNSKQVTITAYDATINMQTKVSGVTGTYAQVAANLASQAGISVDNGFTFPSGSIANPIDGTIAKQIAWLAGVMGKSAYINSDNQLTFRWYNDGGTYQLETLPYIDANAISDEAIPTGHLTVDASTETYTYGSGKGLYMNNPHFTQALTNSVGATVAAFNNSRYGEIQFSGDPAIEVFDKLSGLGMYFACSDIVLTFDCGMVMTVVAHGVEDNTTTNQVISRFQDNLNGGFFELEDKTNNKSSLTGNKLDFNYKFLSNNYYGKYSATSAVVQGPTSESSIGYSSGQFKSKYPASASSYTRILIIDSSGISQTHDGTGGHTGFILDNDEGLKFRGTGTGGVSRVYPSSGWQTIPVTNNTWTNPGLIRGHSYEIRGGASSYYADFHFSINPTSGYGGAKAYGTNGTQYTIYYEDTGTSNYLSASFAFGADTQIRDLG